MVRLLAVSNYTFYLKIDYEIMTILLINNKYNYNLSLFNYRSTLNLTCVSAKWIRIMFSLSLFLSF